MGVDDLIAAVFLGNVLSLAAFYGFKRLTTAEDAKGTPWWALLAVLIPLAYAGLSLIGQ